MSLSPAAFAIPGDINTLTGGYIYERRLLEGLRTLGHDVAHIQLAASFPDPSPNDVADAIEQLCELPQNRPLILDGLVYGSITTEGLAKVRAPIVAMIHHPLARESGLSENRRAHLYRTERDNLALAQHVLVPSPHTATILTEEYGVDPERISIARPGTDKPTGVSTPADPPLILSVGIQHPRKGHDILLKALAQIVDLKWQAVIVGSPYDADHASDLTVLHEKLELTGRVRLAGRVSSQKLNDFYQAAAVFALATRYEGYGIVFDEALAHGLPIVSCRTGAVPDTVPQDAGLLVPPEEVGPFANALRNLLSDTAKRTQMAKVSQSAGKTLPSWLDTARVASDVLASLPLQHSAIGDKALR
ncbi:MAG: glycosyltransferase family 4 protein [Hyphomicrobiales bacterium]